MLLVEGVILLGLPKFSPVFVSSCSSTLGESSRHGVYIDFVEKGFSNVRRCQILVNTPLPMFTFSKLRVATYLQREKQMQT